MTNFTLSIPDDLKKEMDKFPEINWSEVARASMRQKIADLNFLKGFRVNSDISPEDAEMMGQEISKLLAKRYKGDH
ncbi:MAG: hypothetical protein KAX33_11440 [Candidatus Lokiarchaeota archaeon]|nr:hypothetical protein [Candidatus Lokiarchaeota archaeon]